MVFPASLGGPYFTSKHLINKGNILGIILTFVGKMMLFLFQNLAKQDLTTYYLRGLLGSLGSPWAGKHNEMSS